MDGILSMVQALLFFAIVGAVVLFLLKSSRGDTDTGPRGADFTQAAEGWSIGGELKDGTWCYAPEEAKADDSSILVLRDTPKLKAVVDGTEIELRGGFRGFRNVPPGRHEIRIIGYQEGDTPAVARVEIPPGGCMVLIFEPDPNRLEPDRVYGVQYIPLALSGAMDSALFPWP